MLQRFKSIPVFDTTSKSIAVIAGLTVIKDIVIVQSGVDKVNDLMDDDFIKSIVERGNAAPTGIKSRAGHPNMCKDSLGTYLGDFHNFRAVQADGKFKAIADLYMADISKKTQIDGKGISYHDYIVEMAKSHPDKFGNSIVFKANSEVVKMDDGKEVTKHTLEQFAASDIVDSPAATDGLFKSDEDLGIRLTEFLDENPTLFEAIEKNESSIEIFFKKYVNHLSSNNKTINMSLKSKIKTALGITAKNIDVTDATGAILTVVTDNAEAQVGDEVQVAGTTAPDGEYTFPDGSKWTITGGKIETIVAAEVKVVEQTEPVEAPTVKSFNELQLKHETLLKAHEAFQLKAEARFQELEDELVNFATMVKSDYVPKVAKKVEAPKERGTGKTLQEFLDEK